MRQFQENLKTGGRTDGRTDALTLFHSTFLARLGSRKKAKSGKI